MKHAMSIKFDVEDAAHAMSAAGKDFLAIHLLIYLFFPKIVKEMYIFQPIYRHIL